MISSPLLVTEWWSTYLLVARDRLYECDHGRGTGLALVPKLKYEHTHLTSFSKMRVDLAVQVIAIDHMDLANM